MIKKEIKIEIEARTPEKLQGKILELIRKQKRWSQSQLSEKLGVSRSTIQVWENEGIPKNKSLEVIAYIMEVEINILTVDV